VDGVHGSLLLVILRSVRDQPPAGFRLHITTLQWTTQVRRRPELLVPRPAKYRPKGE
jgi:hypothetical protein